MAKTQSSNWTGKVVASGRFAVGELLGEGGMGQVYRARDHKNDRDVVIKVPHVVLLRDPEFVERFQREVESVRKLVHPHIVPVLCGGIHQSVPFVVQRYMPGGSLAEKIESTSLDDRIAHLQTWLPQVADALDFVHDQGFIHRDIKPENIFLDEQGKAYLGDFGIIKACSEVSGSGGGSRLTMTGAVVGTPEYMAPEMAMGEDYDHRSDQYSLAVTVYECLNGAPPFQGATPAAVLVQLTTSEVPDLSSLHASIPTALSAAVSQGLYRDPDLRFESCTEFGAAAVAIADSPTESNEWEPPFEESHLAESTATAFHRTGPRRVRRTSKTTRLRQLDPETPFAPFINPALALFHKTQRRYGLTLPTLVVLCTLVLAGMLFQVDRRSDSHERRSDSSLTGLVVGTTPAQSSSGNSVSDAAELDVPGKRPDVPEPEVFPVASDRGPPAGQPQGSAEEFTNSIGMTLKLIAAGEFLMGSLDGETDPTVYEGPVHRVRISQPYYLQTTEVTQSQWESVMGTRPWAGNPYVKEASDYPATFVSWDDAVEFCRKLSTKEGATYRLPTEAEWEYACRAGSHTAYTFGDSPSALKDYGWFGENADRIGERYPHRAGQKRANAWGLYDMHGNVLEWCGDWYGLDYYESSSTTDPGGPSSGSFRVNRGGSWISSAGYCRSALRGRSTPGNWYDGLGFRVLRSSIR